MAIDNNLHEYIPAIYVTGGALLAGASMLAGYFLGRANTVKKDNEPAITGQHRIEIMKLEHAEREKENGRRLQLEQITAQKELSLAEARKVERIGVAREIAGLEPVLERYLNELERYESRPPQIDPELGKQRQRYREELVDEFKENMEEGMGDISTEDFVVTEDDMQKITRMVDMKFPIPGNHRPVMPSPLRRLIQNLYEEEIDE